MADTRILNVTGHIGGASEVSRIMGKAPGVLKGFIISALTKERNLFVGKKGTDTGVWRKKLLRKKPWGGRPSRDGASGWSKQFVGLLSSGKVTARRDAKVLGDIQLGMGLFVGEGKHIFDVAQFLSRGGTVSSSGEMIIPVWSNLNRLGIRIKAGDAGYWLREYQKTHDGMIRIRAGGVSYYHDKDIASHSASLLFIGVHKITVKKQFDFKGDWVRREPKAIERISKSVSRAIEKINSGVIN